MRNLSFIPQVLNFYDVRLYHVLILCSIGSANSSAGRASDCSSEGHQFEPGLVATKQSSDILQHSQNRPTGDRWLEF